MSDEPRAPSPHGPQVAVGAIIVDAGRLLVVRRAREPGRGRWSLPGGRLRPGELLAEALVREVAEETGLRAAPGPLCGVAELRGEHGHFVVLDYWARASGAAVAGDDVDAVAWADRGALESLELVNGLAGFLAAHGVWDLLR